MKKILFILTLATISLSSCLKDTANSDFSGLKPVLELPYAGLQYYGADAITSGSDTIVVKFGVNLASVNPLSTATTYTLAVDNSLLTAYNASQTSVQYTTMPSNAYTISKLSGTIAAGKRLDSVTVTFYKKQLDPSLSYLLPIKIASVSNGVIISGNFNAHYYHFIGNDFAGAYKQRFQRYNASDSTSVGLSGASFDGANATFSPVSPTEFTVATGYAGGVYVYDVTFTKTGIGAAAVYSNFNVSFTPGSITNGTGSGITLIQNPVFFDPVTHQPATATLAGPYTFAQAKKIFHFQYKAHTSADRYLIDTFY